MAIVQISRITNRKGLTENLPQLAGAEFGWCIDSRRLFIGNGTLQSGAPVIGNTEILTEFSDIVALSDYTYQDVVVGYAAQTGPTPSDPVVRTVQAKLDDFASIRDFGAVGDGLTDDTEAINRAMFQLYCRQINTQIRRTLYFPAGTYRVTNTIIIPAYAKLVGEGADCSIIRLSDIDDSSTPPAYVARYGDSLQQIGVNIGENGATLPQNIEISSMSFVNSALSDVFLVESATQCYFDSVNFQGAVSLTNIISDPGQVIIDDVTATKFAGFCSHINFTKCLFSSCTHGIDADEQIRSITVSDSEFDTMIHGIRLGQGTVINGGPTGFRAQGNMFDNIYDSGIIYGEVSLNVTAHNIFYNVGNHLGVLPETPCIIFRNTNNVSISDMFQRSDDDASLVARISVQSDSTPVGGTQLQLGNYARQNGRSFQCLDDQSIPQPIFSIESSTISSYRMGYQIRRGTVVRSGVFTVVPGDIVPALSYTDDYTENSSSGTGITLAPIQIANTVILTYTSTNTGSPADLSYSIEFLS